METVTGAPGALEPKAAPAIFHTMVLVSTVFLAVDGDELVCLLRASGGEWALPQRAPGAAESLDDAARAEARRLVGGARPHQEQLFTAGERGEGTDRTLRVYYLALIPAGERLAGDEAVRWWPVASLPRLEPVAASAVARACARLEERIASSGIAWSLLPPEFSLSELQRVYEAIQRRTLDKRNFRKWVLGAGLVEATPNERREGAHRPARLYRFTGPVTSSSERPPAEG